MARPFSVWYLGQYGARARRNISEHVHSIDSWLDVGSGEVASCTLMLDARDGRFLVSGGGRPRPISQYDELQVRIGYADPGEDTQERVFWVNRIQPQRSGGSAQVQLEMFGKEARLRRAFVAGRHVAEPWRGMLSSFVAQAAARLPGISATLEAGGVPEVAIGTMDLGEGETSAYDAMMEVLGSLNLPAEAGGANDVFSLTFQDNASTHALTAHVRSQGSRNSASTPVTLDADADEGFIECNQIIEAEEGSRVRLRGKQDYGSFPLAHAEWRSALDEWVHYPEHATGKLYAEGHTVRRAGLVYRRTSASPASTSAPPSAGWERLRPHDIIGTSFDYSPWTKGKAVAWQNMCSNPSENRAEGWNSPAYPDGNLQIRDDLFSRDWVHFGPVLTATGIPADYVAGNAVSAAPEGTRLLLGPAYPGSDRDGRPYANAVARVVNGGLIVTKSASTSGSTQVHARGDQVAVLSTGRLLEWQRPSPAPTANGGLLEDRQTRMEITAGTEAWRDVSESTLGSDCFHRPTDIENVSGFYGTDIHRSSTETPANLYSANSAVRITYVESIASGLSALFGAWGANQLANFGEWLKGLTGTDLGLLRDPGLGSQGWWATLFMAPGPPRTQGTAVTRGELWGHDVLDLNNLETAGLETDTSGALGPTSGIAFWFNFEILVGATRLAFQGDFPFRLFAYDDEGNAWVRDEVIRIQGEPQQVRARWSEFRRWRARTPLGISSIISNLTTPERLELDQLNERRIKLITFQFDRSYDEVGRFNPAADFTAWLLSIIGTSPGTLTHRGTIDDLHFEKAPVAVASATDSRGSTPIRDRSSISNTRQLRRLAAKELEIATAQLATYSIRMRGRADISLDDTIYYHDSATVNTAEPADSDANQRKLVVTRVLHTVTARGAWETTVTAVDRVGD